MPKKNQKKKNNFGLFLNSIWIPCWFENRSEIHRFDEFRKGCRSFANRRGLWTTLFRTYFIERNKRLRRNSRMSVFSTISIQQDRTAFIDSNPSKLISIACSKQLNTFAGTKRFLQPPAIHLLPFRCVLHVSAPFYLPELLQLPSKRLKSISETLDLEHPKSIHRTSAFALLSAILTLRT